MKRMTWWRNDQPNGMTDWLNTTQLTERRMTQLTRLTWWQNDKHDRHPTDTDRQPPTTNTRWQHPTTRRQHDRQPPTTNTRRQQPKGTDGDYNRTMTTTTERRRLQPNDNNEWWWRQRWHPNPNEQQHQSCMIDLPNFSLSIIAFENNIIQHNA